MMDTPQHPDRPAPTTGWRTHWLALLVYALYLARWAQYAQEAWAYRAQPEPGGAGDALGWLLLGQLLFTAGFLVVLLANALWRSRGRRFYLGLAALVVLPWLLQMFLER